jgi:molybdate transport system substrate-binding protein
MDYPRKLANAQLADYKSLFIYSVGHLVLWVPKASPLDVEKRQVGTLMLDSVHKIAIANPQHAPYGRAAEGFLKNQGIYEKVQPKLVFGENIAQTLQFVQSGSADVGIVALSLAMSPTLRDQGRYWAIPDEDFPPMEQGAIVMTKARDPRATHIFAAYLLTPRARAVLAQYGFSMPHE